MLVEREGHALGRLRGGNGPAERRGDTRRAGVERIERVKGGEERAEQEVSRKRARSLSLLPSLRWSPPAGGDRLTEGVLPAGSSMSGGISWPEGLCIDGMVDKFEGGVKVLKEGGASVEREGRGRTVGGSVWLEGERPSSSEQRRGRD